MNFLLHPLARIVTAVMVLLAGFHCACGNCFAEATPASPIAAMEDHRCCNENQAPDSVPQNSSHDSHHTGDHRATCDTGFDASPLPHAGKSLLPSPFFAMPSVMAAVLVPSPISINLALPLESPSARRDGATLVRLHCALTV